MVSSVQGSGGEPQLCIYSQSPPAPCFTTFARQQGISSNQRRTLTTPPVPQAHAARGRGVHLLDSSLRCLAGAGLLNGVFIYRSYASFPCPAFMFIEFVLIVWAVWSYIWYVCVYQAYLLILFMNLCIPHKTPRCLLCWCICICYCVVYTKSCFRQIAPIGINKVVHISTRRFKIHTIWQRWNKIRT